MRRPNTIAKLTEKVRLFSPMKNLPWSPFRKVHEQLNDHHNLAPYFASQPHCYPVPDCNAVQFYQQTIPQLAVPRISDFYKLHLAIWQLRCHDLQQQYPLNTVVGRQGFLAWCVVHGRFEYQALQELNPFWDELDQPAILPKTRWSDCISRFMQLVAYNRRDLKIDPQLSTERDQITFLSWFWLSGGYREVGYTPERLPSWLKQCLLQGKDPTETLLAQVIYAARDDLRAAFSLKSKEGRDGFEHWLRQHAPTEMPYVDFCPVKARAWSAPVTASSATSDINEVSNEGDPRPSPSSPFGVNLIGYAFGELGIGEDVRMAAHALHAVEVPFTVVNFSPGGNIRQGDDSVAAWVSPHPRYSINLVCMTALEQLRLYVEKGQTFFGGRYTIGYWPWELPNWPSNWMHCFNLVDEVWVSSEHTYQAIAPVSSVPVQLMPMAVKLPDLPPASRADYGLPDDVPLFVFSFDGNSFLSRKNPGAVVKAFQQAFPEGDEAVGLVIKCMRPDTDNPTWREIQTIAHQDHRIYIIDKMLSKPDVLALYGLCDCFVSLHRAEGFGRGIAEALLLGLRVITTNYGGNVDFCQSTQAYRVPYSLIPLALDDYVEATGQHWAEPDVSSVTKIMNYIFDTLSKDEFANNLRMSRSSSDAGLDDLVAASVANNPQLSPLVVGKGYRHHLERLF
ncbi:MAG: glycosyltransferase [Cyanobacteria bacterium P01_A01_bin.17]